MGGAYKIYMSVAIKEEEMPKIVKVKMIMNLHTGKKQINTTK